MIEIEFNAYCESFYFLIVFSTQNGFFSAIPYIAFWIFINIFGVICDSLIKSGKFSVKNARRLMTGVGMIPPAILLIITGYVDCTNAVWAIVLLTLAQVRLYTVP